MLQGGVTVDAESPKDEDRHEEQLKRDQNLDDAAILAIEEARGAAHVEVNEVVDAEEQLKRDQSRDDADVIAIEGACAVTHVEADELVDAEELAQVPTSADGQPTIDVPISSASASAHGLSHVQNIFASCSR